MYNFVKMREYLFNGEFEKVAGEVTMVLTQMSEGIDRLEQEKINYYSQCLKDIENSMINGDYLTVTDIIIYDLIPLFDSKGVIS